MGRDKYYGAHETFDRDQAIEGSSDRGFGLVIAAFFAIIAAIGWLRGNAHSVWWLLAAMLFLGPALVWPRLLTPLNRLWIRLALLLNAIVTPVVLFALFYLCIAPLGLAMRLAGKDPLRLRFEPDANSYWICREPPGPLPGSLDKQY